MDRKRRQRWNFTSFHQNSIGKKFAVLEDIQNFQLCVDLRPWCAGLVRLEVELSFAVEISETYNAPLHREAEKVQERLVGSFGFT